MLFAFLWNFVGKKTFVPLCSVQTLKLCHLKDWFHFTKKSLFLDDVKQDDRLTPAYFSPNYKIFDQILHIIRKIREYFFASSLQRFSTNINSTTNINSWHYRLTRNLEQNSETDVIFWITWKLETIFWDHDIGNTASTFRENEFDYRKKAQQITLLINSAHGSTNAGNTFRITFIESLHTQMKLSTETLMDEAPSAVLETDELEYHWEPPAYASFRVLS